MADLFLDYFWLGPMVWAVLYMSDYAFTLACARLYHAGVRDKMAFDGSYEITPFFQNDVNSLRRVSPRFLLVLCLGVVMLYLAGRAEARASPSFFAFMLGAMILVQLAVHVRHVRNYALFRAMTTDAVRGRLEYSRPVLLKTSSIEFLTFAAMFGVTAVFTASPFVLGGAVGCTILSLQHRQLASKACWAVQVATTLSREIP